MIVVILGPQGSGKGTQADLLAEKLNLFHMESGGMLREMAEENEKIRQLINKGILLPDNKTLTYIASYLEKKNVFFDDIIFDGYPRNLKQYHLLKSWLESKGKKINYVIYLEVSEKVSIERLSARRVCDDCGEIYNLITNPPKDSKVCDQCGGKLVQREDDQPETIKKRLEIFKNETLPVVLAAQKDGTLIRVDGEEPIKEIFENILSELNIKS